MRWVLVLWCVLSFSSVALAAPVIVKSGEHDGFTRLVLHLPSEHAWKSTAAEKGIRLEFDGETPEFDLSQVFSRIGRKRLSSVTKTDRGLEIAFSCDCVAKTFMNGSRMLVIDIAAGPPIPTTEEAIAKRRPDTTEVLSRAKQQIVPPVIAKEVAPSVDDPVVDTELAHRRLLKQLGRAASMGLVELTIPDDSVDLNDEPLDRNGETGLLAHQAGLSAFPVLPAEVIGEIDTDGVSEAGMDCPPDSLLDTAKWAIDPDFVVGLQNLRMQLGGEVVAVEQKVALSLARHYLAFGFGAEAQALLPYSGEPSHSTLLRAMAQIIDESDQPLATDLTPYSSCPTSIAMWALLAAFGESEVGKVDPSPVLRAFSDLTVPLQDVLAPKLGAALLDQGYVDAAETVMRIVKRRTSPVVAGMEHLDAQLLARSGDTASAQEKLAKSVQSDAPIAPVALAELIESEIKLGRKISAETVDLLASYYQQHRRNEIAPRLLTVLILANALSGQFKESWSLMESAHEDIRTSKQIRSGFTKALAEHGTDLDVMHYATILSRRGTKLTADANQALAERLQQVGFLDLARSFLLTPEQGADEHDRKLLLARFALLENELLAAKAHLLGLTGPEVEVLLDQIASSERANVVEVPAQTAAMKTEETSLSRSKESLLSSQSLREQLAARLDRLAVEERSN